MKRTIRALFFIALTGLLALTSCNDDETKIPIEEELAGDFIGSFEGTMALDSIQTDSSGAAIRKFVEFPISNGLDVTVTHTQGNFMNLLFKDFYIQGHSCDFEIKDIPVRALYDSYMFSHEATASLGVFGEFHVSLVGSIASEAISCTLKFLSSKEENLQVGDVFVSPIQFTSTCTRPKGTESSEARIETFEFKTSAGVNKKAELQGGEIDQVNHTIHYTCKPEADLQKLKPTITVSPAETAKVYPASDSEVNFSYGQWIFSAVAEDGTKVNYTVTITPRTE